MFRHWYLCRNICWLYAHKKNCQKLEYPAELNRGQDARVTVLRGIWQFLNKETLWNKFIFVWKDIFVASRMSYDASCQQNQSLAASVSAKQTQTDTQEDMCPPHLLCCFCLSMSSLKPELDRWTASFPPLFILCNAPVYSCGRTKVHMYIHLTNSQTDKQAGRQAGRHTNTHTHQQAHTHAHTSEDHLSPTPCTAHSTVSLCVCLEYYQGTHHINQQAYRQINRQTDKQTDRQTDTCIWRHHLSPPYAMNCCASMSEKAHHQTNRRQTETQTHLNASLVRSHPSQNHCIHVSDCQGPTSTKQSDRQTDTSEHITPLTPCAEPLFHAAD